MRIGEVSKTLGINSSAIRFYERNGLISPKGVSRAENGYRVYDKNALEEIRLVVKFKEFGLELKDIKYLLSEESKSCGDLVSSLDEQIEKSRAMEKLIQERISALLLAKKSCLSACEPSGRARKSCG